MNKIIGWDLIATWDDGTTTIVDVPNHIASDVDYLLTLIEEEENENIQSGS